MTRKFFIERILRQVYNGQVPNEASITINLVNSYVNDGLALAAKQNYKENYQLEGVVIINNSFYSTFKGLAITQEEEELYKFTMPSIPLGVGDIDGVARVLIFDGKKKSLPLTMLNEMQVAIAATTRDIPNTLLCYPEGKNFYIMTTLPLEDYKAQITMISGGDSTNLDSELNVPDDALAIVTEYVTKMLMTERMQPKPLVNDGTDAVKLSQ